MNTPLLPLRSFHVLAFVILICSLSILGCGDNCRNEHPCWSGDWNGDDCKCDCWQGWHGDACDQQNVVNASNRIEADISYHFANGNTSSFHFSSDTLNVSMGNGGLYDSIVADGFYAGHINYMHFFIEPPDITTAAAGDKFPIRNFQSTNVCWQLLYQKSAADDVFYPMSQNLTDTITIDAIDLSKSILHASFASKLINGYNDTAFITSGKILFN